MNKSTLRTALITVFCFSLFGCAVGVKSTNLADAPSKPEETDLLKSVGYVLHDEVHAIHGKNSAESEKAYLESERKSWVDALSVFTDQKNIFTMSDDKPTNEFNSFPEFAKTHPIVDVYVKADTEERGLSLDDVAYGSFWITFLTLGITPAYVPIPYTASFTLSMPEEKPVPLTQWDYPYDRQEFYWVPLLMPMQGYFATYDEANETDLRWRIEEKRRLVLRFLQDAKPLLQDH
ncbi:MAG: hypothetical protein WCA63_05165 [Gallionella sp.]